MRIQHRASFICKAVEATTHLPPSPGGYFLPAGIDQTASSLKCVRTKMAYSNCRSYLGALMKDFQLDKKVYVYPCLDISGKFC